MQLALRRAARAAAGLLLLSGPAWAHEPYRVDLVPCTAALCGADGSEPLHHGRVEVGEHGEVAVHLEGAPASASFCVVFLPLAGEPGAVGSIASGAEGHVEAVAGVFEPGVGAGSFRVDGGSCETDGPPLWVTGFSVSPDDEDEPGEDESDNDGDGEDNEHDADDDNDGIDDDADCDDDNDGTPDESDADPDDANRFDGDAEDALKEAYQEERQALKDAYKAEREALKEEHLDEMEQLKSDLADRLDD